ncbi:MAG: cytochrome c biogenesis protein ResB [Christensenellales bacterium]
MKKLLRPLASMKLALLLLGLIVLACVAGGLIPQGGRGEDYQLQFGEGLAAALQWAGFFHLFSAWWFLALVGLLLINLLLCSLLRFSAVLKQYREGFSLPLRLRQADSQFAWTGDIKRGEILLRRMGFRRFETLTLDGTPWRYARRRRLGIWGSWLSHLGMLLMVVGFALGQLLLFEGSVYGVPGQTLPLIGSSLLVNIRDFQIKLRPDDTPLQYLADLTVTDSRDGSIVSGTAMVNAPLQAFGKRFLQNSTGWAATLCSYRGDTLLDKRILCTGESLSLETMPGDNLPLTLVFHAFYPDYVNDAGGPRTRSPRLLHPVALFSLYYQGKLVDMNTVGMGYDIKVADHRFVLSDPQPYTLIQVVGDPAMPLALLGGALMLLGLLLAFYWRPEELWLRLDGAEATVYGRSAKGAALFLDRATLLWKELERTT